MVEASLERNKLPAFREILLSDTKSSRRFDVSTRSGRGRIEVTASSDEENPLLRFATCVVALDREEEKESFFEFECTYRLTYEFGEQSPESEPWSEAYEERMNRLTVSIAEPYLRQTLADTMSRCGLPVITLPVSTNRNWDTDL